MFGPRTVGFRERRRQTAKTYRAAAPSITRTPRAALFVTALLRPRALGGQSLRFNPMPALSLGRRPLQVDVGVDGGVVGCGVDLGDASQSREASLIGR